MKALTRHDLLLALDKCSALTGDREFVVVGSISILGSQPAAPRNLTVSADIDLFPRFGESGEKNELIDKHFGQGSQFALDNNFCIEGVGSWTMMTSPAGWDKRMIPIVSPSGVTGWCIDPFDLAYNKLEAGREKDLQYVGEMVRSEITPELSLATFLQRHAPNEDVLRNLEENLQRAKVVLIAGEVSQQASTQTAPKVSESSSIASGIETPRGPLLRSSNSASPIRQENSKQSQKRGIRM